MREYIKRIANGEWPQTTPQLILNPETIEEKNFCGKSVSGKIHLLSGNRVPMKGIVYSSDYRVELFRNQFAGTGAVLDYQIRDEYVCRDTRIKGRFHIVCNGGEYDLPYQFDFIQGENAGEGVESLEQFAGFAAGYRDEALRLFYSVRFETLPFLQDMRLRSLYDGLRFQNDRQLGMEEFLVAAEAKPRVELTVAEKERNIRFSEEEPGDTEFSDWLHLSRSGWGYFKLNIKAEGDFIHLDKSVLTDEDFTGKEGQVGYKVVKGNLHRGKNFGRIVFSSALYFFQVPITVAAGDKHPDEALPRQGFVGYTRIFFREVGLKYTKEEPVVENAYQQLHAAYKQVERGAGVPVRMALMQAAAAFYWDREESGRLVEKVKDTVLDRRLEAPGDYCLYLYVKSLLNEDEGRASLITILNKYYAEQKPDILFLILLVLTDRDLSDSPAKCWEKCLDYYQRGVRSPWLYWMVFRIIKEDDRLLVSPSPLTKSTLFFAWKMGLMTRKLGDAFALLAVRERGFRYADLVLLKALYRQYKSEGILDAVCGMLIKGDNRDGSCFTYYADGVKRDLKLTKLYDYYLYTMPEDFPELMPKPLLLYFSYQPPADYESRAKLYCNILRFREQNMEIYRSYEKQMGSFAVEQVLKGHINKNLAEIYRQLVYPEMIDQRMARVFPSLLCAREFHSACPDMAHGIFCFEDRIDEFRFRLSGGRTCVPVYTEHFTVVFQDESGNRYGKIDWGLEPLMADNKQLLDACFAAEKNHQEYFFIRLREIYDAGTVTKEEVLLLERGLLEGRLKLLFQRKLAAMAIQYYLSLPSQERCDSFVAAVNPEILDGESRKLFLELLVTKGYYEEAYGIVQRYGYWGIRPGRLLKLCSTMISRYGAFDDYLIRLTHHLFMEDKLDNVILEYLCKNYNGSSERMFCILQASQNSKVNLWDLPERLLGQLIFVHSVQWTDEVFLVYMKQEKIDLELRDAYFIVKEWGYLEAMWDLPKETVWYMEEKILGEEETGSLGLAEALALTRYYAGQSGLSNRQKSICKLSMETLWKKGMVFAHFPGLAKKTDCLGILRDRYYIEYQTQEGTEVWADIRIVPGTCGELARVKMPHMFQGIYVYEVILFHGERAEYEIFENGNPESASHGEVWAQYDENTEDCASRYQLLNKMLAREESREEGLDEMILDYGRREELLDRLFQLL